MRVGVVSIDPVRSARDFGAGAAAGGGGGLWLVGRGAHVIFICFVKKTGF